MARRASSRTFKTRAFGSSDSGVGDLFYSLDPLYPRKRDVPSFQLCSASARPHAPTACSPRKMLDTVSTSLAGACLLVCLGLCVRSRMVRAAPVRPQLHEAVLAAICKLRETDEGPYRQMAAEEDATRAKARAAALRVWWAAEAVGLVVHAHLISCPGKISVSDSLPPCARTPRLPARPPTGSGARKRLGGSRGGCSGKDGDRGGGSGGGVSGAAVAGAAVAARRCAAGRSSCSLNGHRSNRP